MRRLDLIPADLGLPDKFTEFRLPQQDFISQCNDWEGRVVAAQMPTGAGKSLAYMAGAVFSGKRVVCLTSSKGLQNQLLGDFSECGLRDVRGRNNFVCEARKPRSCEWGGHTRCPLRKKPEHCEYLDQLLKARASQFVETNYSYWMAVHQYGEGLGDVDMLVLDEAHDAPEEICKAAAVQITGREIYTMLRARVPAKETEISAWVEFADKYLPGVKATVKQLKGDQEAGRVSDFAVVELLTWQALETKLTRLSAAVGDWAVEKSRDMWELVPLWPARYAEELLFKGVGRIVLVSATIQPKTLTLLGLSQKKADGTLWLEYPSTFPPKSTPFYYVPTVKVSNYMSTEELGDWMARIDEIIDGRLDRKGIIHAVSYDRAKYILSHSRHAWAMIDYSRGEVQETVGDFKSADAPAILVGPSTTTGYDFPDDECRYQIHCKVPFGNPNSPLVKGRHKSDKSYGFYSVALDIVQSDGRGTRSRTDWCENFMIDDQWDWFIGAASRFLPGHFKRRVRKVAQVPAAPWLADPAQSTPIPVVKSFRQPKAESPAQKGKRTLDHSYSQVEEYDSIPF
jgi:Rad3-related DNA helicase